MSWAAGIQAAGSIGGGLISALSQSSANKKNIALQREAWRRDDTAYQRTVSDMLAAGINPMLAVSQGPSNPSSSAAKVEPTSELGRGVSSALQALALQQQQANIRLTDAQAMKEVSLAQSAAGQAKWAEDSARLENMIKGEQWANLKRQYDLTEAQVDQIREMLPLLVQASQAQTRQTEQATSSAKTQQELDRLKFPEAQVTAEWFSSLMGGGSRVTGAIQDILRIIMMLRGRNP